MVLIAAILLVPVSANAHAGIVATAPAQDQELTLMPAEISVTFSEELMTISGEEVNTISLTHFDGPAIEVTDIKVEGAKLSAQVPAGDYESGTYEVVFKIVSADGHKVNDSFTFAINAPTLMAITSVAEVEGDGVLPLPILGAIVILVILGGFLALRSRNRKN